MKKTALIAFCLVLAVTLGSCTLPSKLMQLFHTESANMVETASPETEQEESDWGEIAEDLPEESQLPESTPTTTADPTPTPAAGSQVTPAPTTQTTPKVTAPATPTATLPTEPATQPTPTAEQPPVQYPGQGGDIQLPVAP